MTNRLVLLAKLTALLLATCAVTARRSDRRQIHGSAQALRRLGIEAASAASSAASPDTIGRPMCDTHGIHS